MTTGGTAVTRTTNALNQITTVSGSTSPTYNSDGDLTKDETGQTYVWNAWNQLVEVKNSSGTVIATYSYDPLGRMVTQTESGTTTDLYYDGDNEIEDRQSGNTTTQYVWDPSATNTLVERDNTPVSGVLTVRVYYDTDANNNVTCVIVKSGSNWVVGERYRYSAYGSEGIYNASWSVLSSSSYATIYGFQDERQDNVTGNLNFLNRWYRPSIETFATRIRRNRRAAGIIGIRWRAGLPLMKRTRAGEHRMG